MTPESEVKIIELLAAIRDELRRSNTAPPELLKQSEVADLLRVDTRTVRTWVHEQLFPAPIRIRSELRWRRAEIMAWLQAKKA